MISNLLSSWLIFSNLALSDVTVKPELEWCLDDVPNRHHYPATGQPYGPTVNFMQELATRSGFTLTFSPNTPFSRCLRMMQQGKTDLMTGLNHSDERAGFMWLMPYDQARAEKLFLHRDTVDITSMSELSSKRIGLVRGYIYNTQLPSLLSQHGLSTVETDTLENGLQLLQRQRIDALIAPANTTEQLIASDAQFQGKIIEASLYFPFSEVRFVNIGLSRHSKHAHLAGQINQQLALMAEQGLLQRYYPLALKQD
ncbi:substrate-binding periplasmic protein [Arsukibacterium sp.]|uniref:substrate-binding periplasmic protein n=1 Tax=Arsukibacterium sp. TaxID=1977258 RepID=UPI002FD9222A